MNISAIILEHVSWKLKYSLIILFISWDLERIVTIKGLSIHPISPYGIFIFWVEPIGKVVEGVA